VDFMEINGMKESFKEKSRSGNLDSLGPFPIFFEPEGNLKMSFLNL
jgi:hypothetical protein